MKIVAFETEDWEKQAFFALPPGHEVVFVDRVAGKNIDPELRDADIVSVFVHSNLDADTLMQFPTLKLIVTRSTGYNHVDLAYCRRRGIGVSNAPEYGPTTVAEYVFALLHTVSRHIPEAVERTRRGNFSIAGLRGFDLQGKTLGVIGTGEIGMNVIRIARGYEMNILATDVRPDESAASRLGFRYVDMDTLLAGSDIITIHVPGIEATRNLIDGPQFDRMKRGVVLINTARGFIVNSQALLKALYEEKVAGAGLDVLSTESVIREEAELLRSVVCENGDCPHLLAEKILADLPNVIVTPHIAFDTVEAVERLLATSVENISAFLQGKQQNIVIGVEQASGKKVEV